MNKLVKVPGRSACPTRREWLAHCSGIGAAAVLAGALALHGAHAQTAERRTPLILVVGDSLSAEYGLQRGSGWVALLDQRLAREKVAAKVVNASISGDTTSGGRSRLPSLLAQPKRSAGVPAAATTRSSPPSSC